MTNDTISVSELRTQDLDEVRRLFRVYQAALPIDLAYQQFEDEVANLPAPYVFPHGELLLARVNDPARIVGMVGFKRWSDTVAEIKRMYVSPAARGQGIGHALLGAAVALATEYGYRRLRLDSHRATMAAAIGLYKDLGFVEIEPYGPDLDGQLCFFELVLS